MGEEIDVETNVNELLKSAKKLLMLIEQKIGSNIFSIIYNPYKEGIKSPLSSEEKDDSWYLRAAIENSKLKKAVLILHGPGGDFKVGMKMAFALRKGLDNYRVIVPFVCSSALCFLALKSDQLEIFENTDITQIDPLYEENGQLIRAIEAQYSIDETKRQTAKKILADCKEKIINLIKLKPSLYDHRKDEWEEYYDAEKIADRFMYKHEHMEKVTYEELIELNLKIKKTEDKELMKLMKSYNEVCQEILLWEDRRVIIGCSQQYKYLEGPEGNFLRLK